MMGIPEIVTRVVAQYYSDKEEVNLRLKDGQIVPAFVKMRKVTKRRLEAEVEVAPQWCMNAYAPKKIGEILGLADMHAVRGSGGYGRLQRRFEAMKGKSVSFMAQVMSKR